MVRIVSGGLLILVLAGCVHFPRDPIRTEVVTFPPGARVEVNGKYRGDAPVRVTLPQDQHGKLLEEVTIRAVPVVPGRYTQSRHFSPTTHTNPVPARVMIDLREKEAPEVTSTKPLF